MPSTSRDPYGARLEAVLAENETLRFQVESLRAERNSLAAEIRRVMAPDSVVTLVSGTLHDFKNLLTVIAGHTDLILPRLEQCDPLRRSIEAIRTAAASGVILTHHLLQKARGAAAPLEPLDPNAIVENVSRMIEGALRPGIVLVTRPDPSAGHVHANPAQIEQVLVNLAVNALDAMPDGGCLTFAIASETVSANTSHPAGLEAGCYVVVTVQDTGRGIDPCVRLRLFEPYVTTKTNGTGLGLATASLIVKRHGGVITAGSVAGEGSTFRVYLPRLTTATRGAIAGGAAETVPERETILVVDDEPELLELVREILELHGYRVLAAPDTRRALEIATSHAGPIHLLIADIVVPGMGVQDFRSAMLAARPEMLVLYVSGHTEDEIQRRFGRLAGPVLKKPFAVGALADKVRAILDERPA